MISVPWQCGQCRTCMIMMSLDSGEGCSDSRTPKEHSRPTPLKHLLTALGQARFHDEHQRSVSGTGRKLNSSVAQSFHIPQRTDGHELDVLPFLPKDAQLLGCYQGHEGTRHKIRNGDTHVVFPCIKVAGKMM